MKRVRRSIRVLWNAFDRFNRNDGSPMAGYIAFSGLLSLFPFLIFATTLIGILVGSDQSDSIIDALFEIAPANMAQTLSRWSSEVLNKQSGEVLTLSALFAIWVASNAVEAFRIAFDRAYAVADPRNFFQNRALAIALVFLGALVAALLGRLDPVQPAHAALPETVLLIPVPVVASYITYVFGIIVFMGFVLTMHRFLPGRRLKASRLWPGVLVTTVLWVGFASAFSLYLSYTPTYTVTYGTLAGVIITLMFFYLTGATIIFGAEVNAALNQPGWRNASCQGRGMAMGLKKRRRIQLVIAGAVLLTAATGLVGYAMRDGIEFFRSPSQLASQPPAPASASASAASSRTARWYARTDRCGSPSPMAAPVCPSSSPASRRISSARARASSPPGASRAVPSWQAKSWPSTTRTTCRRK